MENQRQTLAQRFIEALHRLEGEAQDIEGMVTLFSEDARLTNAALALAGAERTGHDGVRQFWSEYRSTFSKARSDFHQVTINEQAAGLFWTTQGADDSGQPIVYDGASLLIFDQDGFIAQFRGYYDTRQLTKTATAE
jgi:ketosteroid isomerase-like protein